MGLVVEIAKKSIILTEPKAKDKVAGIAKVGVILTEPKVRRGGKDLLTIGTTRGRVAAEILRCKWNVILTEPKATEGSELITAQKSQTKRRCHPDRADGDRRIYVASDTR